MGDVFGFARYDMASQSELHAGIQEDANVLFEYNESEGECFKMPSLNVKHRLLMECLHIYPIVNRSKRMVIKTCVMDDYEVVRCPVLGREHLSAGYDAYGLVTPLP